jgi:CRP/FNR family cyclic AMP-dependent transcriptional regulator
MIRDGIGLIVIRGLLIRRVGIDGRFGAELLGEGDVLRPWHGEDAVSTFPSTTEWRVIDPVIVACSTRRVARRFAHFPELTGRSWDAHWSAHATSR